MNAKRYRGGDVPLGWFIDGGGMLAVHQHHQALIRAMVVARHDGHSLRTISEALRRQWSIVLSHEGVRHVLAAAAARGVDIVSIRSTKGARRVSLRLPVTVRRSHASGTPTRHITAHIGQR